MTQNNATGLIGLSHGEQKTLERYGILVGNTFNALVNGKTFTVQRSTMGLKILRHAQGMPMASVPGESVGRY